MFKQGSSVSVRIVRIRRYLATLFHLWLHPVRFRPVSEMVILVSGLIARLAPLAAFIATIQFAVWLISPERGPVTLRTALGYDENPLLFHIVIISIPILIFLLGAGAQKISDHLSMQVRRITAFTLIDASLVDRLDAKTKNETKTPPFFAEIRADYQTVHRSVQAANNILNSFATVVIAAAIGFLIAPYFVALLLLGLAVLAALFVAWRHRETNQLLEQKQSALRLEVEIQKDAQKQFDQKAKTLSADQKVSILRSFVANAIGNPNELDDRFRSTTNFVSIFAPLVGVTALLAFLSGESEVTEERAAQLVMLVLVLRFCIGNIQSIITGLIGITRDYARLTKIFSTEEVAEQTPLGLEQVDDAL